MDLILNTDADVQQGRVPAPAAPAPGGRTPTGPRARPVRPAPLAPLRLLPRDREMIARVEARARRRRMLLNAAVGILLLLLTAIGIRYETRPSQGSLPAAVVGR